jgi:hypothetical protein
MTEIDDKDYYRLRGLISNYLHNDLKLRRVLREYIKEEIDISEEDLRNQVLHDTKTYVQQYLYKNHVEQVIRDSIRQTLSDLMKSDLTGKPLRETIQEIIEQEVRSKIRDRVHVQFGKQ